MIVIRSKGMILLCESGDIANVIWVADPGSHWHMDRYKLFFDC